MDGLKRVVALAALLSSQQSKVDQLEEELKEAKINLRRTEREDLPALMEELGVTQLKLDDGSVVSLQQDCDCGITERTRDQALTWLNENGFGGLINVNVNVQFGRGERTEAIELAQKLAAENDGVVLKEDVHHSTLKSFVKEQLAAGAPFPTELFNVFPYNKATLKKGK